LLTTAPRGTKDILPAEVRAWRYVEKAVREICANYGYKEIRTPMFEHTELFLRSIGENTDVVDKEMYTFIDRGKRSITLRPENTASAVRAYVEHKLYAETAPVKLFYMGPMFRYDRPQAGRQRQFHQFGVEALGAPGPNVDAEIILLAVHILEHLGLKDLKLKINSVGCPKCRPIYRKKLQEYFRPHVAELCEDCRDRLERNPMRILDCKVEGCKKIAQGAPKLSDYLCEDCQKHFTGLQELLKAANIQYVQDSSLVRGLDYYTRTAFEIQDASLGAQSAVCGGGRYDGLVEEIGGPATPGIGFAMGLERLLISLETQKLLPAFDESIDVYVVVPDPQYAVKAFTTVQALRNANLTVEYDYVGRSMKGQMKQANKLMAKHVLIFGSDEGARGNVTLKNMASSEQKEIALNDVVKILKTEVQKHE
jgi:histidyl-tRNA synthetase